MLDHAFGSGAMIHYHGPCSWKNVDNGVIEKGRVTDATVTEEAINLDVTWPTRQR